MPIFKMQRNKIEDEVAEWLRRWTANPLGFAREGSNPFFVEFFLFIFIFHLLCQKIKILKIDIKD